MNESTLDTDSQSLSPFLPLTLLGLSFAILLVFQISDQFPQRAKFQEAIKQRTQMVQQSIQLQGSLQKLIEDFNTAAPDEAKTVMTKYGIQLTPKTAPAPSPAN